MRLAMITALLVGCHAGYLSPTYPVLDTGEYQAYPDVVADWVGSCDITQVTHAASPEGEDGIEIGLAIAVTGQKVVCSESLGDSKACYQVNAPAVNGDWPGSGEGQLDPEGGGPFDIVIHVEAEGYCFPEDKTCEPSWDLYLWGDVADGQFSGDCQSISTGIYDNYPVTWGSGAFSLEVP